MSFLLTFLYLAATFGVSFEQNVPFDLTVQYANVSKAILQAHNKVRQETADMPDLIWNAQLAQLASNYALNCLWQHSAYDNRSNVAGFSYVGENIAAGSIHLASTNIESIAVNSVNNWCAEVKDFTYPTNCTVGKMCGHFTQVVWADTTNVGCGLVSCAADSKFIFPGGFFLVCNYGPGGNYDGERPYIQTNRTTSTVATTVIPATTTKVITTSNANANLTTIKDDKIDKPDSSSCLIPSAILIILVLLAIN